MIQNSSFPVEERKLQRKLLGSLSGLFFFPSCFAAVLIGTPDIYLYFQFSGSFSAQSVKRSILERRGEKLGRCRGGFLLPCQDQMEGG